MLVQKILNKSESNFQLAKKYFKIIFTLNDLHVTDSELNLITFSALNGTISTPPVRDEFIKQFNIPIVSVYNMSSKLQKLGILIKDNDKKIRLHPSINLKFNEPISLILKMEINGNTEIDRTGDDQTS